MSVSVFLSLKKPLPKVSAFASAAFPNETSNIQAYFWREFCQIIILSMILERVCHFGLLWAKKLLTDQLTDFPQFPSPKKDKIYPLTLLIFANVISTTEQTQEQ